MNYSEFYIPVLPSTLLAKNKLIRVSMNEMPVVLSRFSDDSVRAFEDFCPHRGAMLSQARLINNEIVCAYHGWRFNERGENTCVPVKNTSIDCALKCVIAKEKYGLIWLSKNENAHIPELGNKKPDLAFSGTIEAKLENALENFLEGSHTHFVHNGLVRSAGKYRQKIKAKLLPNSTGFQVAYEQEAAKGLLTKLLPEKYRKLKPVSTFIYPSIAILEYFNEQNLAVARIETIFVPDNGTLTFYAKVNLNVGILSAPAAYFSKSLFRTIIMQDKQILERQEQNIKKFKDNKFYNDETDIVGREIFAWLYNKERVSVDSVKFEVYW